MNERPWLKNYDEGVPHHIEYREEPLFTILEEAAQKYPENIAIRFYNHTITYRELDDLVDRVKSALYDMGIRKGDRVALMLPNTPHYVISYYAVLKLGATVVQMNPLYSPHEIEFILSNSEARAIITLDLFVDKVKKVRDRVPTEFFIAGKIQDFLRFPLNILLGIKNFVSRVPSIPGDFVKFTDLINHEKKPIEVPIDPKEDIALFQYTGGTTGFPKAVMLTHFNLMANVQQTVAWNPALEPGRERTLVVIPLFHVYAMTIGMNYTISIGGEMILLPKFHTKDVLELLDKHRVTLFPGVPAIYNAIINYKDVHKYNLRSIKVCISGAAPLPVEVKKRFEELTGAKLVEGYGLSEASPVTHVNPIFGVNKAGSIGIPLPDTDAMIADEEGNPLPTGEVGELAVRGPQVMKGYWKNEEETRKVLRNGWLFTGDMAKMDEDGYFYIVDRKKDMIIVKGFNVYPRVVEEVLYKHPKVQDAAVVGVKLPDRADELVKAFVVLKEGETATKEEIIEFCRQHLAPYEVPQEIEFVAELPKSMVGKTLRRILREKEEEKLKRSRKGQQRS